MGRINQNKKILIEFEIANKILRHDCVRIRSILIVEGIICTTSIILFALLSLISQIESRIVVLIWCTVSTLLSFGCLLGVLKARSSRKRIIGRVNYLRDFLFNAAGVVVYSYRLLSGFRAKGVLPEKLFLLPQMLGAIIFFSISFLLLLIAMTF